MARRLCEFPAYSPAANPEQEAWNQISKLTNFSYVHYLLNERIRKNFHGFEKHIVELNNAKTIFTRQTNNRKKSVEMHKLLSEEENPKKNANNINNNSNEITILTRQAIELYRSSQLVSILVKPIILYYSYSRLARVLFLSMYKSEEPRGNHGLFFANKSVICQPSGAFARFHDSFSWDPSIYIKSRKFAWEDLIGENLSTHLHGLILNMRRCNTVAMKETSENTIYNEHELTREIIFVFAMSTLSRYKAHKWNELIKGKESDAIWKVQEYLTSTQTIFPNLIFNQLHGKQYYFYPVQPELMVIDTQYTNNYPWNR